MIREIQAGLRHWWTTIRHGRGGDHVDVTGRPLADIDIANLLPAAFVPDWALPDEVEPDFELIKHAFCADPDSHSIPIISPPRSWSIFIDGVHTLDATWSGGNQVEFVVLRTKGHSQTNFERITNMMMVATMTKDPINRLVAAYPACTHGFFLNMFFVRKLREENSNILVIPICRKD